MLCPVCLFTCKPGPTYHQHVNSLMVVCPMSGQPAFVWDEGSTRPAVAGRSGGICEFCGAAMATDMHHRISRGVGGDWSPANVIHLCRACHRRATEHPQWAYSCGLMVHGHEDPAAVAVIRMSALWLTDDVAPPLPRRRKGER